jgi:hypothetical protein
VHAFLADKRLACRIGLKKRTTEVSAMRTKLGLAVLLTTFVCGLPLHAQQKGQWVPGQSGLNAGVLPEPGFTYANLTVNYSADTLNDSNGNPVPITGSYGFWALENILYYVPNVKVLGGKLAFMGLLPAANGSLTADGPNSAAEFGINAGGYGYADTYIQPLTLGWHLNRADTYVGYGFFAPTGRFTQGATNNVGSGYWGHNIVSGTTIYLTKNKGTTANLTTDWEIHMQKRDTNETPGQAFTMEWGLGQVLPLKKDMSRLLQVGVIGYDQWQVSENGGTLPGTALPARLVPFYSVHAIGFQTNFIVPEKNLNFFFKYEPEYLAKAHPQGRTIVFGGSWTLRMPKPKPKP